MEQGTEKLYHWILPLNLLVLLTSGRSLKPWLGFLSEDMNITFIVASQGIGKQCLQGDLGAPDNISLGVWLSLSLAFQAYNCIWSLVSALLHCIGLW